MDEQLFSDTWHQVSGLKVSLVPDYRYIQQWFRGERWYILEDRFGNRFIRVTPEAFQFLNRLKLDREVGEVWQEKLMEDAETTPTQHEIVRILTELRSYNLIQVDGLSQSEDIYQRGVLRKQKELKSKLASFLFVRIPVWNPEPWLKSVGALPNLIFNRLTFVIWLILGCFAGQAVISNLDRFGDEASGVLSMGNLPLLYIVIFVLKLIHEFGHALMTKRFGGTVPSMGIMLLIFTPIPYMDATSNWIFRNKYHRILVGAAGMFVELFFAFIAAIIWANTGAGVLNALAFNVMLIGSISSLVFNGNPLLKFDAYYMLSDQLEIPNLYERSRQQWQSWVEQYLFGLGEAAKRTGESASEQAWLGLYGALSLAYRILVTVSIIFFVSDRWFLLGVFLGIMAIYTWILKPVFSYIQYLMTEPSIQQSRSRAVGLSLGFIALVFVGIYYIPAVKAVRAPGVIWAKEYFTVFSPVAGRIAEAELGFGDPFEDGQILCRLDTRDLELNMVQLERQLDELNALLTLAVESRKEDIDPLKEKKDSVIKKLEKLNQLMKESVIIGKGDGFLIGDNLRQKQAIWVQERDALVKVVKPDEFEFVAVFSQADASELFRFEDIQGQIRLLGRADAPIHIENVEVLPYEQSTLPSAALGWMGGGDIPVKTDDSSGLATAEKFFKVVLPLPKQEGGNAPLFIHNRQGVLRIVLDSEPLGHQLARRFLQILQKRYRL
jgi:putative peptide zinc metalloprotease protein